MEGQLYTPFYKKGIKENRNSPMETTIVQFLEPAKKR